MISIGSRSRRLVLVGLSVLVLGGGAVATYALTTSPTVPHGMWNKSVEGVAIGGYDTVAYFTGKKEKKGHSTFSGELQTIS